MTGEKRQITIVILTHNRADRCLDCVSHAARALHGISGEILVINNGEKIEKFPSEIAGIPCKIIDPGKNLGAGARNIALETTESDYMLMLDDDAYLEQDTPNKSKSEKKEDLQSTAFRTLINIFRSDQRIGAVAFKVICNDQPEACLLPTIFHGCACGFRTSALKKIEGYPADYLYYGEEYHVAFNLYQAGYRIVMSEQLKKVRHLRDVRGRNTDRIMRLLIRNNAALWISSFPWLAAVHAVSDTLRRYMFIARKEKALRGFAQACIELPKTIARGIIQRNPLNQQIFRGVTLIEGVEAACRIIRQKREISENAEKPEIIICGVGKFPSLWIKTIKRHGIVPVAFWDTNQCWKDQRIHGIPVAVYPEMFENVVKNKEQTLLETKKSLTIIRENLKKNTYFLVGTASLPETDLWKKHLIDIGMNVLSPSIDVTAELFAPTGTFDLLDQSRVEIYTLP